MADKLEERFPGSVVESNENSVVIDGGKLLEIATFLRTTPEFDFDFLTGITAVDYKEYFELVYQLTSIGHNHSLILKTKCHDRINPSVPSVVSLWQGADFQEREAYDLMGIGFEGRSDLRRIVLWEGFQGHPLRKDFK